MWKFSGFAIHSLRADDSIAHARRLVQARPGSGQAHNSLGIALLEAGRPEEAREDLLSLGLNKDSHVALWRGLIARARRVAPTLLDFWISVERSMTP